MSEYVIIATVVGYFLFLITIAQLTKGSSSNATFFSGNKASKWYLVAFGMIGASLSGVTFLSIPGQVAKDSFSYMQIVFGYMLGYTFIALVLLPLYYKLNVVSIYQYLYNRFGNYSHKTGAAFFLLSRIIGASFRLFLVAGVLHHFLFESFGWPFLLTTIVTVVLIWVYTFQGGIRTIVFTDTLQTLFMLLSLILSIYFILKGLNLNLTEAWSLASKQGLTKMFYFEDFLNEKRNFFKHFLSGALIATVMTGLDQDMMQKNLSCKNVSDAKKNIMSTSLLLIPINFLFLCLGAFLYLYAFKFSINLPSRPDYLYPDIALNYFPMYVGIIFLLGLLAAAYSSADSALTSLTTAFCVDFLGMNAEKEKPKDKNIRWLVHIIFSIIIVITVGFFNVLNDDSVIKNILTFASYTYGPLLGMFIFGLTNTKKVYDKWVPLVCILSPFLTYGIATGAPTLGYTFGYELLLVNGGITFVGLLALSKKLDYDK